MFEIYKKKKKKKKKKNRKRKREREQNTHTRQKKKKYKKNCLHKNINKIFKNDEFTTIEIFLNNKIKRHPHKVFCTVFPKIFFFNRNINDHIHIDRYFF